MSSCLPEYLWVKVLQNLTFSNCLWFCKCQIVEYVTDAAIAKEMSNSSVLNKIQYFSAFTSLGSLILINSTFNKLISGELNIQFEEFGLDVSEFRFNKRRKMDFENCDAAHISSSNKLDCTSSAMTKKKAIKSR